MDLDLGKLGDVAGMLVKAGAPVLGTVLGTVLIPIPGVGSALGGLAGNAVAGLISDSSGGDAGAGVGGIVNDVIGSAAKALGVPQTLEAVSGGLAEALKQAPDVLKAKFAAEEAEAAARYPAQAQIAQAYAEVAKEQIEATRQQMQAELAAAGTISWAWLRNFTLFMAAIWRPLYAVEGLVECAGFAYLLYWILSDAFKNGHTMQIQLLASVISSLTTLLMFYMSCRFGLLGFYMKKRSDEKVAGAPATSSLGLGDLVSGLGQLKGIFGGGETSGRVGGLKKMFK